MFYALSTFDPFRDINIIRSILSMQPIKVVIIAVRGTSVARLQQKVVFRADLTWWEPLPGFLVLGAIEVEGPMLFSYRAFLRPDPDLKT